MFDRREQQPKRKAELEADPACGVLKGANVFIPHSGAVGMYRPTTKK